MCTPIRLALILSWSTLTAVLHAQTESSSAVTDKLHQIQQHYTQTVVVEVDTTAPPPAADWNPLGAKVEALQRSLLEITPHLDLSTHTDAQFVPWLNAPMSFNWRSLQSSMERGPWFSHLTGNPEKPLLLEAVQDQASRATSSEMIHSDQLINLLSTVNGSCNSPSEIYSAVKAESPPKWKEVHVGNILGLTKLFQFYANGVLAAAQREAVVSAPLPAATVAPTPVTPLLLPPLPKLTAAKGQTEPILGVINNWNLYLEQYNTLTGSEKWSARLQQAQLHLQAVIAATQPLQSTTKIPDVVTFQKQINALAAASQPDLAGLMSEVHALEKLVPLTTTETEALKANVAKFLASFAKFAGGLEKEGEEPIEKTLDSQWTAVTTSLQRLARLELICKDISTDFRKRMIVYRDLAQANTPQLVEWMRCSIKYRGALAIRNWQISKNMAVTQTSPIVSADEIDRSLQQAMAPIVVDQNAVIDNFLLAKDPTQFATLTAADVYAYIESHPALQPIKDRPLAIVVSRATLKGAWNIGSQRSKTGDHVVLPNIAIIGVDIRMAPDTDFKVAPGCRALIWCETFSSTLETDPATTPPARIGLLPDGSGRFIVLAKDCASIRLLKTGEEKNINFVIGTRRALVGTWGHGTYNKAYTMLADTIRSEIHALGNSSDAQDQKKLRQVALLFHKVDPPPGLDQWIYALRDNCVEILNRPAVMFIDNPLLDGVFGLRVSEGAAGHRFVPLPRYFCLDSGLDSDQSKFGTVSSTGSGFKFQSRPITLMHKGLGGASVAHAIRWNKSFGIDDARPYGLFWRTKIDADRFKETQSRLAKNGIEITLQPDGETFVISTSGQFIEVAKRLASLWTTAVRFSVPIQVQIASRNTSDNGSAWTNVENGVYLAEFAFPYLLPSCNDPVGLATSTGSANSETPVYFRPRPRDVFDSVSYDRAGDVHYYELDLHRLLSDSIRFPTQTAADVLGEPLDLAETKVWLERSPDTKEWHLFDFVFPESSLKQLRLSADQGLKWKFPFHQSVRLVVEFTGLAGQKRRAVFPFDDSYKCAPADIPTAENNR